MKIVGITSCPAGVAHTYMVAEAIEEKCKSLDYECKIETQGANGAQNVLTAKEIADADYVILALGKNLPPDQIARFNSKKVIFIKISTALKNLEGVFSDLEGNSKVVGESKSEQKSAEKSGEDNDNDLLDTGKTGVIAHMMAGVSAAIPFIVGGGLLVAIAAIMVQCGMPKIAVGEEGGPSMAWILDTIGQLGFTFMIPVMGAYIAYSIGEKPAFAPAFICSWLANSPDILGTTSGAGFLGAVILGLAIGYTVKYMRKINLGKYFQPLLGFFFIPVLTFLVFGLFTYFVLGPFCGWVMQSLLEFLEWIPKEYEILVGFILGVMTVADLGGPINKAAWAFEIAMLSSGVYCWYAVAGVVQVLPPMAVAIACWIRPSLFTKQERGNSITTFIVGATVATEPAIPYALAAPLPMFAANMLAGGIAGGLTMFFGIERIAPSITILDPLFGLESPIWAYYVCVAVGIALNVLFIILFKTAWLKRRKKKEEAKKAAEAK